VSDHSFTGFHKEANFELTDGKWYQNRNNSGLAEAHEIRGINWVGMEMLDGPARCYGKGENGHYKGMGWSPTATFFGQAFRRMVLLDGGECEDADEQGLKLTIPTFEFIPISGHENRP
jgi:hypothetical protein